MVKKSLALAWCAFVLFSSGSLGANGGDAFGMDSTWFSGGFTFEETAVDIGIEKEFVLLGRNTVVRYLFRNDKAARTARIMFPVRALWNFNAGIDPGSQLIISPAVLYAITLGIPRMDDVPPDFAEGYAAWKKAGWPARQRAREALVKPGVVEFAWEVYKALEAMDASPGANCGPAGGQGLGFEATVGGVPAVMTKVMISTMTLERAGVVMTELGAANRYSGQCPVTTFWFCFDVPFPRGFQEVSVGYRTPVKLSWGNWGMEGRSELYVSSDYFIGPGRTWKGPIGEFVLAVERDAYDWQDHWSATVAVPPAFVPLGEMPFRNIALWRASAYEPKPTDRIGLEAIGKWRGSSFGFEPDRSGWDESWTPPDPPDPVKVDPSKLPEPRATNTLVSDVSATSSLKVLQAGTGRYGGLEYGMSGPGAAFDGELWSSWIPERTEWPAGMSVDSLPRLRFKLKESIGGAIVSLPRDGVIPMNAGLEIAGRDPEEPWEGYPPYEGQMQMYSEGAERESGIGQRLRIYDAKGQVVADLAPALGRPLARGANSGFWFASPVAYQVDLKLKAGEYSMTAYSVIDGAPEGLPISEFIPEPLPPWIALTGIPFFRRAADEAGLLSPDGAPAIVEMKAQGVAGPSGAPVRADIAPKAVLVSTVKEGIKLEIIGRTDLDFTIGGPSLPWYLVRLSDGRTGWAHGSTIIVTIPSFGGSM